MAATPANRCGLACDATCARLHTAVLNCVLIELIIVYVPSATTTATIGDSDNLPTPLIVTPPDQVDGHRSRWTRA
jgi:hypothetical protein